MNKHSPQRQTTTLAIGWALAGSVKHHRRQRCSVSKGIQNCMQVHPTSEGACSSSLIIAAAP